MPSERYVMQAICPVRALATPNTRRGRRVHHRDHLGAVGVELHAFGAGLVGYQPRTPNEFGGRPAPSSAPTTVDEVQRLLKAADERRNSGRWAWLSCSGYVRAKRSGSSGSMWTWTPACCESGATSCARSTATDVASRAAESGILPSAPADAAGRRRRTLSSGVRKSAAG